MLSKNPGGRNIYKSILKCQQYEIVPLYKHKSNLKKYIEKKCGSLGSEKIPPRHKNHVHKYRQVNGLMCGKGHKVELINMIYIDKIWNEVVMA